MHGTLKYGHGTKADHHSGKAWVMMLQPESPSVIASMGAALETALDPFPGGRQFEALF